MVSEHKRRVSPRAILQLRRPLSSPIRACREMKPQRGLGFLGFRRCWEQALPQSTVFLQREEAQRLTRATIYGRRLEGYASRCGALQQRDEEEDRVTIGCGTALADVHYTCPHCKIPHLSELQDYDSGDEVCVPPHCRFSCLQTDCTRPTISVLS